MANPLHRAAALLLAFILLINPASVLSQRGDATFCAVHHFADPSVPMDAKTPSGVGAIARASDGSVWTAINQGGEFGAGAIIKVTPEGQYFRVRSFESFKTGGGPLGGLTDGKDGYFYGTTYGGGKWGPGTIFRIAPMDPNPQIEVLYDFRNGRVTGIQPKNCIGTPPRCDYYPYQRRDMSAGFPLSAPVVVGGMLYGATSYSNAQSYGTIYSLPTNTVPRNPTLLTDPLKTSDGDDKFQVVCIFDPRLVNDPQMKDYMCGGKGITPSVLLSAGPQGPLFGTTAAGNGTVFKATGGKVQTLHEFNFTDSPACSSSVPMPNPPMAQILKDGTGPSDIMLASDGNLYGTTRTGGLANWGALYKLDPQATPAPACMLSNFLQPPNNAYFQGNRPASGVVEGPDGMLYGVLASGGDFGHGVLYRVAKDGSQYQVLHAFGADGSLPATRPMFDGDTLYGTSTAGGKNSAGTFYRLQLDRVLVYGGTLRNPGDAFLQVKSGATAAQFGHPTVTDGLSVRMQCDNDPHFVQFIYREEIDPKLGQLPGAENQPNGSLSPGMATVSWDKDNPYPLTTDPNNIQWHVDGPAKPSPFFEDGHSAERDCDALTLFDRPERGTVAPKIERAVVRDYAICGGQVRQQVTWISDQITAETGFEHWLYSVTVTNAASPKIPDYFLCLLQNNGYNLPIGVPAFRFSSSTPNCANLGPAIVGKP